MKLKISLLLLSLAAVAIWMAILVVPGKKLHVYFCDVGQGDGALVVYGLTQIIIDTGPDGSILNCLTKYMPFYDHDIEAVIVTHPQQDHMGGLTYIAESYNVIHLFIPPAENDIRIYRQLLKEVQSKKIIVTNIYTGDKLEFQGLSFQIVWPSREFVNSHAQNNGQVLGWKSDSTDLNSFAIVGTLTFGDLDILFTGDADAPVEPAEISTGLLRPVDILKVPHHGSKTGMTNDWLETIRPQMAVISVGKSNRYGHPTKEALELLSKFTSRIYRTDEEGTIEIVSDGKTYWFPKYLK